MLGKVAAGTFEARVRQLTAGNPLLVEVIEALLKLNFNTGFLELTDLISGVVFSRRAWHYVSGV